MDLSKVEIQPSIPPTFVKHSPQLCSTFFSKHSVGAPCDQFTSFLTIKEPTAPPFSCEDGGGIPSQPDWIKSGRGHQDVFKDLRSKFFTSILDRKLHLHFVAHVESKHPTAPFSTDDVAFFSSLISDFLESPKIQE